MRISSKNTMFWLPRILTILFALFISLFALDVFSSGYSFWDTIFALMMHLIPTAIVVLALIIAWRWELPGGFLFIALGILYVVISSGRGNWFSYVLISGIPIVVGLLFAIDWLMKTRLQQKRL